MVGLLDPLKVGEYILSNRIVMPPMLTNLATTDGAVTEKLIEHYIRRAEMLGLLIVEASYVSKRGNLSQKQLGIYDENLAPGLRRLSEAIHGKGTPVIIQIIHAGAKAYVGSDALQPVAPSAIECARKLKVNEIESLLDDFADATKRAVNAGFDGVEIHSAHGFLVNQFFSPLSNRRNDKYGGSLKNRMKFPLEVVERVKEKVGKKLLLYRIGADDLNPNGTKIEDSVELAKKLEQSGVDIIDVSGGLCGSSPPELQNVQGYFIPQAHRIKSAVKVPVIGVGNIKDAKYANKLVEEGSVDLVAIGRELIKNPHWAAEAVKALKDQ
jgi:NADPH2 dehydrogenase